MDTIWVEKYRPKSLDDVLGNAAAVKVLRSQLKRLQHLLLCGPAGVGKTSSLHCLAAALLGPKYASACLELNAADERGIDVVRERIKNFAKQNITLEPGQYKIVILDEVDAMTESAQQALRRVMEQYHETTRFALACNQAEKVIDPIQSRCLRIQMMRLSPKEMRQALEKICAAEHVEYESEALDELIEAAEGDLRKAVGSLQAAATAFSRIAIPSVYHACDIPPTAPLVKAFEACRVGNWREAHDALSELLRKGYGGMEILKGIRAAANRSNAPDVLKIECQKEITSVIMNNECNGIDALQVDAALCKICRASMTIR